MSDRDENTGQFIKGKKGGPGRPKGSRAKLGEAFVSDLQADWEENGVQVIETVRKDSPEVYLKTVASILPRDLSVNINPLEEATDDELIQRLRDLHNTIGPFLGAEAGDGDNEGTGPQTTH